MKRYFASDYCAGMHPKILEAVRLANKEETRGYGEDRFTNDAQFLFRTVFGMNARVVFMPTGSSANLCGVGGMFTEPHQAVMCAQSAHMHRHESGALEFVLGRKLVTVPTGPDGKLTPDLCKKYLTGHNIHEVTCSVLSLSQATEGGTHYTLDELCALKRFAGAHGMAVHMDGARFAHVAAKGLATPGSVRQWLQSANVQVMSLGGTKNGADCDAIVCFNDKVFDRVARLQKMTGHLKARMRLQSAQWIALLQNDLWLHNAENANAKAELMAEGFERLGVEVTRPVETNAVFVRLSEPAARALAEHTAFEVWDKASGEYRFMCSWATTRRDVDDLIHDLRDVLRVHGPV